MQTNNTSGVTGVSQRTINGKVVWMAMWQKDQNKVCVKTFDTKEKAVEYRKQMVQQHYDMAFYSERNKNEQENGQSDHPNYTYFLEQRKLFVSQLNDFETEEWKVVPDPNDK